MKSITIPSLVIEKLQLKQKDKTLLSLDEEIIGGQVLTIMGPSGSGKSTLLNWLVGMLPNEFEATGKLYLNGADVSETPSHQRHIGLLYQDPLLFPHLTVEGNIAFAMPKGNKQERLDEISETLKQVGLEGMEKRCPESLSGGQQARVALLRVLLSKPKAILLDEPFSKLDSQLRQETRQLVFEQIQRYSLPAVMVTHDQSDATAAKGKVITLDKLI
ncbi:ATP-binding cassette domain-containing protein [Psychromonas sp. KJ10-2]|uniref:ATP-binding cassette domain-containing protein n=1 Tax=Psychromonas sp. KJ10-2 TaxID=3391822 RepID=UPI0039B53130